MKIGLVMFLGGIFILYLGWNDVLVTDAFSSLLSGQLQLKPARGGQSASGGAGAQ